MSEVLANPSHDNFAKLERHQIIEYIVASIEVLQQTIFIIVLKNNHLVSRHLGRVSVLSGYTSAEPESTSEIEQFWSVVMVSVTQTLLLL